MTTRVSALIIFVLILTALFVGMHYYPLLPAVVASHWDINGHINGHMPKFWGLFGIPLMMVILSVLFYFLPVIDPFKQNWVAFRKYYNNFVVGLMVFFVYIYAITIALNLGYQFDVLSTVFPALGLLFFGLGMILPRIKRNWFFGVRTPWTIGSERVWDETHALSGTLFKVSGIIMVLGILIPNSVLWVVIVPVLFSTITLVVYSYVLFKKYE